MKGTCGNTSFMPSTMSISDEDRHDKPIINKWGGETSMFEGSDSDTLDFVTSQLRGLLTIQKK